MAGRPMISTRTADAAMAPTTRARFQPVPVRPGERPAHRDRLPRASPTRPIRSSPGFPRGCRTIPGEDRRPFAVEPRQGLLPRGGHSLNSPGRWRPGPAVGRHPSLEDGPQGRCIRRNRQGFGNSDQSTIRSIEIRTIPAARRAGLSDVAWIGPAVLGAEIIPITIPHGRVIVVAPPERQAGTRPVT